MPSLRMLVALVVTSVAFACAGTKEATKDVKGAIPGVETTKNGIVQQIRQDRISVRLEEMEYPEPVEFTIAADTVVEREGTPMRLQDLQEGTPVRVHFEPAIGPERAFKIEVLPGAGAR